MFFSHFLSNLSTIWFVTFTKISQIISLRGKGIICNHPRAMYVLYLGAGRRTILLRSLSFKGLEHILYKKKKKSYANQLQWFYIITLFFVDQGLKGSYKQPLFLHMVFPIDGILSIHTHFSSDSHRRGRMGSTAGPGKKQDKLQDKSSPICRIFNILGWLCESEEVEKQTRTCSALFQIKLWDSRLTLWW